MSIQKLNAYHQPVESNSIFGDNNDTNCFAESGEVVIKTDAEKTDAMSQQNDGTSNSSIRNTGGNNRWKSLERKIMQKKFIVILIAFDFTEISSK